MMTAKEFAYSCKSWVILLLQQHGSFFLGIDDHTAEFIYIERTATKTYAFLLVNGGAAT